MITAKFVKSLKDNGRQILLSLSDGRYVVSSKSLWTGMIGPETYLFPANEHGEVTDWCELEGSFQGAHDHLQAIQNAGWEISDECRAAILVL